MVETGHKSQMQNSIIIQTLENNNSVIEWMNIEPSIEHIHRK